MQLSLRHIVPTAAAALILGGCAGESYPGLSYDIPWNDDIINNESGKANEQGIQIEAYVDFDSFRIGSTRATGPFIFPERTNSKADSNRYEKSVFHIFAFRDTLDAQGLPMPDYTKRSNDPDDPGRNCLVDGNDYLLGMPVYHHADRSGLVHMLRSNMRTDTALYWGTRNTRIGYNFFGYFLDDYRPTAATARRDAEGIVYDIDIDGTQDLMYGHSERLSKALLDSICLMENFNLDDDEKQTILNIRNYSAYAAYHGIAPHIKLQHGLVRLRFQAFPADASCDSVTIESIEIYSKYKTHLRVVADDFAKLGLTFDEDRRYLVLQDSNYTANRDSMGLLPYESLHTEGNTVSWKPEYEEHADWRDNHPTFIGGDLLVAPDSVYRMKLTYRQTLRNYDKKTGKNLINRVSSTYDLPAPQLVQSLDENGSYWYLPSHTYHVNIGVFGLRAIVVNTSVEGWEEGEIFEPNTEDEFDGNYPPD